MSASIHDRMKADQLWSTYANLADSDRRFPKAVILRPFAYFGLG